MADETRRRKTIALTVLIAAGILYYINQVHVLSVNWQTRMHGNDFWHLYSAGLAIRQGLDPYNGEELRAAAASAGIERLNPFVYLPFTAVMMVPFTFVSPGAALGIWFFLNHLLFLGALAFLAASIPEKYRLWTAGLLLLLGALYFPLTRTLTAGQLNVILLFLLSAAIHCLSRGSERAGGVFLGLATMVKVSPAFLILFLAWKRRWKALGASLVTIGALLVFSVVVRGPGYGLRIHVSALGTFRQMGYGSSTWSEYGESFHVARANISPSSVIYRLLTREPRYAQTGDPGYAGFVNAPGLAKALSILTGLGLIALLAWATHGVERKRFPLEFGLAVVVMLLVPSLFWDHYLTLLFVPFAYLVASSLEDMPRPSVILWVAAAVFLSRPYPFFANSISTGWETVMLAPHVFAVLLIGALLACEIRRPRAEPES